MKLKESQKREIMRYIETSILNGCKIVDAAKMFVEEHPEYKTTASAIYGIYYQQRKKMKECTKTEIWTEDEDKLFDEIMKSIPQGESKEDAYDRIGKLLDRSPENVKFHYFSKQKPSKTSENLNAISGLLELIGDNITVIDLISRISNLGDDDFLILKAQVDAVYFMKTKKSVKIEDI